VLGHFPRGGGRVRFAPSDLRPASVDTLAAPQE
jgi:hypothetical protein